MQQCLFVTVGLSLPSRERELKPVRGRGLNDKALSLPSRERELKLRYAQHPIALSASLPSRERELKRINTAADDGITQVVAPFAGARVETFRLPSSIC